jgi:periplasmic divalent cation tolerance protein
MESIDSVRILVGTTTFGSKEDAVSIIDQLVRKNLAKCGQIDGPIESHYLWEGEKQVTSEWRVTLKFSHANRNNLEKELFANHPYDTQQWVVWETEVEVKYGNWVNSGPN